MLRVSLVSIGLYKLPVGASIIHFFGGRLFTSIVKLANIFKTLLERNWITLMWTAWLRSASAAQSMHDAGFRFLHFYKILCLEHIRPSCQHISWKYDLWWGVFFSPTVVCKPCCVTVQPGRVYPLGWSNRNTMLLTCFNECRMNGLAECPLSFIIPLSVLMWWWGVCAHMYGCTGLQNPVKGMGWWTCEFGRDFCNCMDGNLVCYFWI